MVARGPRMGTSLSKSIGRHQLDNAQRYRERMSQRSLVRVFFVAGEENNSVVFERDSAVTISDA
jgi:hypothetical protein